MTAALLLLLCAALPAAAQTEGRFTGVVMDPTGGFMPGTIVTAINEQTGEVRTATTNPQGRYIIANLKPSIYTLKVEVKGFAPLEFKGLPLAAAQEFPMDLKLQTGGVSETITVLAATPPLDFSSARLGANVSAREVSFLPVNGRQMSQLMLQAPGSQNAGTGTWGDVRFSGRAVEQNVVKYDGIEGSGVIDSAPGVANGENATPFKLQSSLENVQEFRVESSSYPAEFGTGTGGQIHVVTKSGSNQIRGSFFEYVRNDRFDAKNFFDDLRALDGSIQSAGPKSPLSLHQFGGSMGGPLAKNRAFFFASVESYRLDAGLNFIEGVPSDAAWARAVPAIAALRPGFLAPDARIIPGGSTNADFDIAQRQANQRVRETSVNARVDLKLNSNWSAYVRVSRDEGDDRAPQGVTGRVFHTAIDPTNAVFSLTGLLGNAVNELKVGYNAAQSTATGETSALFTGIQMSLSGAVANSGIAGQSGNSALAAPGGLVRVNSAGNGRSAPYDPFSLTLANTLTRSAGSHLMKVGADVRMIRMAFDQLGGITYSFSGINQFLANTPGTVQYFGDISESTPFHPGVTGQKHTKQNYFVVFAQDEWHVNTSLTLSYGLRYDYYTPIQETDNRIVKFNIETGALDPDTTPLFKTSKGNIQPRLAATYALTQKTVLRGGFGVFVGPGQTEDQIQPVEAERISTTLSTGVAYPVDPETIRANFINNPSNRSYQPRAYANDYEVPERVYQYTVSVQREFAGSFGATVAYLGSQGRNLFLRSVANRTVGVISPTNTSTSGVREFDVLTCADGRVLDGRQTPLTASTLCAGSSIASVQRPFAEIDYKTSGGRDSYNGLQLALTRRATRGLALNAQYTYAFSKGTSGGSNEARTVGNNARALADFGYDDGYNNFDVRHTFNISALYTTSSSHWLLDSWTIGGIINGRSGVPLNITIVRPDVVFVDDASNVFASAGAGRVAVLNTPGGGSTRSQRRPDLIPGVNPFLTDGGLIFLNPAAFAIPKPGEFGNLERNSIHGPNFKQVDLMFGRRIGFGGARSVDLRWEIFNIFNEINYDAFGIGVALPNALPTGTLGAANTLQPGQPYTSGAAGTFGRMTRTVGTTVGLGTPRQMQFAVRFNF